MPPQLRVHRGGLPSHLTPGNPGNSGGKKGRSGRLPSVLRDKLRGSFQRRIKTLERIADGHFVPYLPKGVKRADVCTCGKEGGPDCSCTAATSAPMAVFGVGDQLKALELLAKYGLGTTITETDTQGNDAVRVRLVRE